MQAALSFCRLSFVFAVPLLYSGSFIWPRSDSARQNNLALYACTAYIFVDWCVGWCLGFPLENFATKCRVRVFSKKQSPSVMYLKLERANMYKKQNVRLVPEADTLNLIEVSIWRFSNSARSCQLIINLPFEISPTTAAQQSKCLLPWDWQVGS